MTTIAIQRTDSFPANTVRRFTNASGGTLAVNQLYKDNGVWGVVRANAVANGAEGVLETRGQFALPKTGGGGVTFAVGDPVAIDDASGVAVPWAPGLVPAGRAFKAAADADTEVEVCLNELNTHGPEFFYEERAADADEDTANTVVVDTGFGVTPRFAMLQLRAAAGTVKAITAISKPGGADAGKVSATATDVVAGDIVTVIAVK